MGVGNEHHLRDAVYGLAVGDALGVPYEFQARDTFECHGMTGHGTHHKPAGTWSDDTSLALATCDSIRDTGRIDVTDMRRRFERWYFDGEYTVDGLFDVGNTCAAAINSGEGRRGERDNGNGSLMRIAPLAFTGATDAEVEAVSAITHAHPISTGACVAYVRVLRALATGATVEEALGRRYRGVRDKPRAEVRSGGFVLDTLDAALWCLVNTDGYEGCVLAAVNLGSDTDTTAAVAGALAGAHYGLGAIPAEWLDTLRGKDVIEACLF